MIRLLIYIVVAGIPQVSRATAVLPQAESFKGQINFSAENSLPDWPTSVRAPAGAPNILLIMLDDVGFGDASTFGGAAETPALDELAAEGLRYVRFHTTSVCAPTRAALLSGRNHHRMGFGGVGPAGFPGYNWNWKKSAASIAEVLRRHGYSTAAFGKWHLTPFHEISPIGPFDRWPTGLGFEYYYGNLLGLSNQWEPELWRNTLPVEPPKTITDGYHYTTDITEEAIRWLHTQRSLAPDRPYFIYFATGAAHFPHHVPREWIERYKGKFDQGWDKLRHEIFARQKKLGVIPTEAQLTPRPNGLPRWSRLSSAEKRLYSRQMEVYAAFISHTDYQIGRLINAVKAMPGGENTLILYIVGDNGAAAGALTGFERGTFERGTGTVGSLSDQAKRIEALGGATYYFNHYATGWAVAGNTPFQGAKASASHLGGTRNPLVVSWPARIKDKGGLRMQFTHVNDVAPTLYEAIGISTPAAIDGVKQLSMDGVSFVESFDEAEVSRQSHGAQYFEYLGNRAIYKDGWIAAARHIDMLGLESSASFESSGSYADDVWELYHIDTDFSQARNLAARHPAKLEELRSLFEEEALRNNVYPLISSVLYGPIAIPPREKRTGFTFHRELPRLPTFNGPLFTAGSLLPNFSIEAEVVIPDAGAEGAIVFNGSPLNWFALYVKADHLIYEYYSGSEHGTVESHAPLPRGKAVLVFEFVHEQPEVETPAGGARARRGTGRLYVNGHVAGERRIAPLAPAFFGSFGVGQAFGSPASPAFQPPFRFTGTLDKLTVTLE